MMLSSPLRERFHNVPKNSPLSVMDVPDVGYRLASSSSSSFQSEPGNLKSCHMQEPAHPLYLGGQGAETTHELSWNSAMGIDERERRTLSDLILQRKWAAARTRLASPKHQHEIQERIPIPFSSQESFHALPLHLACALRPLPPASFVRFIIKLHPPATKVREKTWGLLPLHFAVNMGYAEGCFHDDLDLDDFDDGASSFAGATDTRERAAFNQRCIVSSLVEAYPDSLVVQEKFSGMLPIHIAASTASSHYNSLTSNAVSIIELLIKRCPISVEVKDDWGETPREIAWRNATFNCLRCRVRGRYIASDHGRCPHVAQLNEGKVNPLLRKELLCPFEMNSPDDTKTLT